MSDDLADSIDDYICSFENAINANMDTLAIFVFVWLLVTLFLLWLGKLLYQKYLSSRKSAELVATGTTTTKLVVAKDTTAVTDKVAATTNEIPATKVDVKSKTNTVPKSAISKVTSSSLSSSGSSNHGSGYVPPTPPTRKRLSRRSPGPVDLNVRRHANKPIPRSTGSDPVSVKWVDDVFQWLYNDFVIANELLYEWIHSLNEFAKKSVTEQGVGVEFVRILPESPVPNITNVFCECDTKEDVTITCDCETTLALQLKCFRQVGEKVELSHYRINVNRFRARLNIICITEKLTAELKCDGWPDIKVSLAAVGNIKNNLDEVQLQDVLTDIVVTALRNTELKFNLSQYPTCPRLNRHPDQQAHMLPIHYDSMNYGNAPYTSTPNDSINAMINNGKRLLVKIIKADNLKDNGDGTSVEPYCVVEMDEPFQKNQTSVKHNEANPQWNEHFLFDLSSGTAELLFEVYDRANRSNRFLGLGIVGVEELLINPAQRQVISLQSRPYENDDITGTLTVEFLFIEGPDIPVDDGGKPFKLKETLRTVSPGGQLITTTRTTFANEGLTNGTVELTDSALRELERNKQGNANKSTLIIHSVQRVEEQRDGSFEEVEPESNPETKVEIETVELPKVESTIEAVEITDSVTVETLKQNGIDKEITPPSNGETVLSSEKNAKMNGEIAKPTGEPQATQNDYTTGNSSDTSSAIPQNMDDRGRTRKKRNFFGTIRRRFGRSGNRSKSATRHDGENGDYLMKRSVSADRNIKDENVTEGETADGYRIVVPNLNKSNIESTSRRSSLSEASGISGTSTRTYLNEASTLVLETLENGVKKHYLVPLSLAQRSKWRKKGVKLHIFNEHTFIAKHLTGGTVCQVCSKNIARRLGKQGYECRDCLIKCHKQCHVKINDTCPTSTIHNLELSYITNPYTDKNFSLL